MSAADLPVLSTRAPASRRVPSATLAKRPVVLAAPASSVALAYGALTGEVLSSYRQKVVR